MACSPGPVLVAGAGSGYSVTSTGIQRVKKMDGLIVAGNVFPVDVAIALSVENLNSQKNFVFLTFFLQKHASMKAVFSIYFIVF